MSANTYETLSAKVGRRSFMKMAAVDWDLELHRLLLVLQLLEQQLKRKLKSFSRFEKVKTVCTACSVGCGIIAEVQNGVWVRQEVTQDHPVSLGGHCCKGADMIDMVKSEVRVKHPMVKKMENGKEFLGMRL